jgi:membrane protein YdbS with pleckstrin-like domain
MQPSPDTPTATTAERPTSLWQLKPWWCQPWTIILTGIAIPLGSWEVLGRWWLTLPLVLMILVWWLLFLYWVPRQFQQELLGGRKDLQ